MRRLFVDEVACKRRLLGLEFFLPGGVCWARDFYQEESPAVFSFFEDEVELDP